MDWRENLQEKLGKRWLSPDTLGAHIFQMFMVQAQGLVPA